MTQHYPNQPCRLHVQDKEKVQKVIQFCKQLGVEVSVAYEHPKETATQILVKIPNKTIYLCDLGVVGEYNEKNKFKG